MDEIAVAGDDTVFAHAGLAFGGEALEPLADVPMTEEEVLGPRAADDRAGRLG